MRFVRTAENLFGLPQGFTRVEYLQSSGTQYINTGVLPVNDMEFECKFTFTSLVSTNLTIVGSRDGEKRCQPIGVYNNKWSASIGCAYDANGTSVSANTPYIIKSTITNGQTIATNVNGSQASTCTSTTGLPSQELYIFARNFYGNTDPADSKVNGRLYFLKIKANGVLVRDFIPCKDPLGVPCMYDLVGKKPYYNAGTVTFTAGRQVIPVEYLESTGTQYIDTGYIASNTSGFKVDIMPLQATDKYFIGSRPRLNSNDRFLAGSNTGPQVYIGWNTNTFVNWELNKVHTVQNNFMNSRTKVLDGTVVAQISETLSSQGTRTVYLFSANDATAVSMDTCRIYKVQISEGSSLVRDYIPCKDENNVGFMFDKVSGTCYLNAGTGSFSVGENKYTSKLRLIRDAIRIPAGYTRVEYLESTGTQYIDTGYKPNTNTRTVGRCYFNSFIGSNADYVFGVFESPNNYGFNVGSARQYFNVPWGTNSGISLNGLIPQLNTDYDFDISKTGYKINGTSYGSPSTDLVNSTRNMYLFWSNGTSASGMNGRIYYLKIYDNGTLVRSFIPVRDSNNVGYMYDEFTGQLFSNAGSGSFGIGNDLPTAKVRFIQDVLPREYRPLKYLESTGTQYILTGFTPTVNTDFELELSSTKTSTNWTMGCPTWVGVHYKGTEVGITNSSTASYQQYAPYNHDNSRITLKLQGNTVYANGVSLGTITRRAGTLDFALFGYRDVNQGAGLRFTGSIYKCIIWDNGVPVLDLYPALRKADNKPGMYDRITKQFFTNDATSGNDFNYE